GSAKVDCFLLLEVNLVDMNNPGEDHPIRESNFPCYRLYCIDRMLQDDV
ncbi:hypothetical protein L195_g060427, partial [Trifolium pratense]